MLKLNKTGVVALGRKKDVDNVIAAIAFITLIIFCLYPDISFAVPGANDLEKLATATKNIAVDKVGMPIIGIAFVLAAAVSIFTGSLSYVLKALAGIFIYVVASTWINSGATISGLN